MNMKKNGYNFNSEQCKRKWKSLKNNFVENDGYKTYVTWPYYSELKEILSTEFEGKKLPTESKESSFYQVNPKRRKRSFLTQPDNNDDSSPPFWFTNFLKLYQEDETLKMNMLHNMHNDIVKIEKKKCKLLKTLVDNLS